MPFAKKKNMHAGYIVDFFDDTKEEWDDNYGWSKDDSERGVIVDVIKSKKHDTIFRVITGAPSQEKIVETPVLLKFKIKNALSAPVVQIEDGDEDKKTYLIEDYVKGKKDSLGYFWRGK